MEFFLCFFHISLYFDGFLLCDLNFLLVLVDFFEHRVLLNLVLVDLRFKVFDRGVHLVPLLVDFSIKCTLDLRIICLDVLAVVVDDHQRSHLLDFCRVLLH